jgi:small conductance mechanosensitive channel
MEKLNEYFTIAVDKAVFFAPRFIGGAIALWIGFKLIKKFTDIMDVGFKKAGFTDNIRPFLISIVNVILKIALLMAVATILGADLTGLVAILAAAGFAIGMALQGSLGNFASGILILSLKPYKVGDWVSVDEKFGKVEEIGIFSTIVVTPGHKTLIIPNAKITDGVVTNYSNKGMIRLELQVTMPYDEDFPKVKEIIKKALEPIDKILATPVTDIGIIEFDTHFIKIGVLPYTKPDDYWEVTYESYKNIKRAFSEHGVKVAYSEGVEMGTIGK